MSKDKRDPDYPGELESQFLMRLPEEPAKKLREILKTGDADTLKNRLTIQLDNDMRSGEVKLDHWTMNAKIVDLPTIVESLKTIDNKNFYKTADICQMMVCKEEPDQPTGEEESMTKNKKKDAFKVDKKFLWPHGITPPTKNGRNRRFRKTLKKKSVEGPEIEKEVKRLLRSDNEADNVTWELIIEEDPKSTGEVCSQIADVKPKRKPKKNRKTGTTSIPAKATTSSCVVDIFGGAVSDSDLEDDAKVSNVESEDCKVPAIETHESHAGSEQKLEDLCIKDNDSEDISSLMFDNPMQGSSKPNEQSLETPSTSGLRSGALSSEDDGDYHHESNDMTLRIEQAGLELQELKQRRQRIQHEISGMDNVALRQRFLEILHTLNQDIMYKEMEYQGMITLQNSEDI